mmetsp:Transcript_4821/g.10354  ORF Transcript_4821/g.10354 Transcript_4821/m.10354 type:complete len:241 (-) Transcript_4821:1601-2323(-)
MFCCQLVLLAQSFACCSAHLVFFVSQTHSQQPMMLLRHLVDLPNSLAGGFADIRKRVHQLLGYNINMVDSCRSEFGQAEAHCLFHRFGFVFQERCDGWDGCHSRLLKLSQGTASSSAHHSLFVCQTVSNLLDVGFTELTQASQGGTTSCSHHRRLVVQTFCNVCKVRQGSLPMWLESIASSFSHLRCRVLETFGQKGKVRLGSLSQATHVDTSDTAGLVLLRNKQCGHTISFHLALCLFL